MRKILSIILASMVMYSCSNEMDLVTNEIQIQETEVEVSNNVTLDDIHAYMQQGSEIASRNSADGTIEVITHQNDTVMYLLNYKNGWEMMPGDKRFPIQIAFNENGNLNFANLNDAQRAWFSHMAEKIHFMKLYGDTVQTIYTKVWNKYTKKNKKDGVKSRSENGGWILHNTRTSTSTFYKEHLITTLWSHDDPYNQFCPTKNTSTKYDLGCVAVAGAQVLLYMHNTIGKPTTTPATVNHNTTNDTYTFTNWVSSEWDLINQNNMTAIARLAGNVSVLCETNYLDNSSSNLYKLQTKAFSEYGINSTYDDYWLPEKIKSNLNNNKPVIGGLKSADGEHAHAVIIDGYKIVTTTYTDVYIYVDDLDTYPGDIYDHDESGDPLPIEGPTREETYTSSSLYYMLNWGYGLEDNSYYYSTSNIPDIYVPNYISYSIKTNMLYDIN